MTGHHLTEVEVEKEAPIFLLGPRVQDGEDPLLGPHLKKGKWEMRPWRQGIMHHGAGGGALLYAFFCFQCNNMSVYWSKVLSLQIP